MFRSKQYSQSAGGSAEPEFLLVAPPGCHAGFFLGPLVASIALITWKD